MLLLGVAKKIVLVFSVGLIACTFAQAVCSVDVVLVRGRVDNAPGKAKVHVQLLYPKGRAGESGDVAIENGTFSIPIEFLTQSRRPAVNGMLEKCNRRPSAVIVTLVENNGCHEYDRVTLNFSKDFRLADPTAYALRSELVLKGSR